MLPLKNGVSAMFIGMTRSYFKVLTQWWDNCSRLKLIHIRGGEAAVGNK